MITTNIKEFEDKIYNFQKITWENLNKVAKTISFNLFSNIINDTPILTGRLVANWNFSVNNPNFTVTNYTPRDRMYKYPKYPEVWMRKLEGDMNQAPDLFGDDKTGVSVNTYYLSNGWEYIHKIEYLGYSKKAPNGMVRKNIQKIANMSFDRVRFN